MVDLRGFMNHQEIKGALGMKGGVNPIATKSDRREKYRRELSVHELQQFVRRYRWTGLPKGLDATLMERILYFRGQVVLFKIDDTYYSTPFALNGNIDLYGRYQAVSPLTFNGSTMTDANGEVQLGDGVFLQGKVVPITYDLENLEGKEGVILYDYTPGISSYIIPRYQLNITHVGDLADIVVLIRHNLISSARIYAVRCLDEGQKDSVYEEFSDLENSILEDGKRIFAVTAPTSPNELFQDKVLETQTYWECFVSLDNLRENLMGIENTGIFKKKERELQKEAEIEAGNTHLIYQDGLYMRQRACELFNALFNENIWCEESETIKGQDIDGDGNIDDEEGMSGGMVSDEEV